MTEAVGRSEVDAEVVVVGATAAGVCAAVAAAEAGAQTVLVGPEAHVGGMTSGGLGYTDVGDRRVLGGPAARFRAEVAAHYGVAVGHYAGPEPHVAESILTRWLEEAGVTVLLTETVVALEQDPATRAVRALRTASGIRVTAGAWVDAGYEGDLLAAAGVPSSVGREDRSRYGERFAGRREPAPGVHAMPPWVSPFADDPDGFEPGPALPGVRDVPMAPVGSGDGGVMAYGYRVCMTSAADRVPFPRPDRYDDADWELGRRLFALWDRQGVEPVAGRLLGLEPNLPNGKCDGNSLGPFSLNLLDGSAWTYPLAGPAEREELRRRHLDHTAGFLWFLAHDPAVPAGVRRTMAGWGLPADEFADTGHLPHQLYVREARRMEGQYVLTEQDLVTGARHGDVVALGSYHIDIREVQRTWWWVYEHPRPVASVVTEGYLSVPVPVYDIPYRTIVPRERECPNLLVPVCLSASHVAFASVRMEPQYQMLGHAAGLAAAASVRAGVPVQRVDVPALQEDLRRTGQVLAV